MKYRAVGTMLLVVLVQTSVVTTQDDDAWNTMAQKELNKALGTEPNTNVAKNVIFFLGDGMGVSTVTAGRIYKGQQEGQEGEETVLSFERFPNVALSKTYNTDRQTADSAGTATAFLCGVKANMGTLGVNERVKRYDCPNQESGKVTSILKWSLDEGKSAGIVTTTRVTHATPAAGYAHSAERGWEGDKDIASDGFEGQCKDIAVQLIENLDLQVIMGGGRRYLLPDNVTDPETGAISSSQRADGRNLIEEWKMKKSSQGKTAEYVWKKSEFDAVDPAKTDSLLGIFESSHMQYDIDRDSTPDGEPSLAEMTEKAINILKKQSKGYFLLVEAGRIDHGHHGNRARKALHDLVAMDKAVETAVNMTDESDTLIVVSADHSHVFSMGGYPLKGRDILGLADSSGSSDQAEDGMPKTTLIYGNGPGFLRENLTYVDTTDKEYRFPSAIKTSSETHAGEDVAIYAQGPMAHLFHGVHEQNYIAHVMAYASCVGSNKKHCDREPNNTGPQPIVNCFGMILCVVIVFLSKLTQ